MRPYELVVIFSPDVAEDEMQDSIDRLIRQPVEGTGGEVADVNQWGRRKLAYPIQKHLEGNYVLTQLRLDPQRTKELEQRLVISEDVLRYLLVRLEELQPKPKPEQEAEAKPEGEAEATPEPEAAADNGGEEKEMVLWRG